MALRGQGFQHLCEFAKSLQSLKFTERYDDYDNIPDNVQDNLRREHERMELYRSGKPYRDPGPVGFGRHERD